MYGECDKYYMRLAIEQARAAMALGEVPIGAVIVKDGEVIAAAHNMCESSGDPTAHAELTALQAAAERIGKRALCECELYVTVEPCAMCAGAIINARLKKAVFGAHEERTGCLGSVMDISEGYFINSVRAYGGVLEDECAALMGSFLVIKGNDTSLFTNRLPKVHLLFLPMTHFGFIITISEASKTFSSVCDTFLR